MQWHLKNSIRWQRWHFYVYGALGKRAQWTMSKKKIFAPKAWKIVEYYMWKEIALKTQKILIPLLRKNLIPLLSLSKKFWSPPLDQVKKLAPPLTTPKKFWSLHKQMAPLPVKKWQLPKDDSPSLFSQEPQWWKAMIKMMISCRDIILRWWFFRSMAVWTSIHRENVFLTTTYHTLKLCIQFVDTRKFARQNFLTPLSAGLFLLNPKYKEIYKECWSLFIQKCPFKNIS